MILSKIELCRANASKKSLESHNNYIGKTFGRLTVLSFSHMHSEKGSGRKRPVYKCKCVCGNIKLIQGRLLGKGTRSCGCLNKELKQSCSGSNGRNAKIKKSEVNVIRQMSASGLYSFSEIARIFNVTGTTISKIIHKITYKADP